MVSRAYDCFLNRKSEEAIYVKEKCGKESNVTCYIIQYTSDTGMFTVFADKQNKENFGRKKNCSLYTQNRWKKLKKKIQSNTYQIACKYTLLLLAGFWILFLQSNHVFTDTST